MADHINDNFDLICDEASNDLFFSENDDDKRESFTNGGSNHGPLFDVSLPCLSDECIAWMVQREMEFRPRDDYAMRLSSGELDLMRLRKDCLLWIVSACVHFNFGELCLYSAMSYLDRFLSVHEFPFHLQEENRLDWTTQLAAVACLSLAAKMHETNAAYLTDLQALNPNFTYEVKTIHRMEKLILSVCKWRLKCYTPFDYIDFYLRKMNDGELPPDHVITKSAHVMLHTLGEIKFLEYKPSEIAAAVALYVLGDIHEVDIDNTWSEVLRVEKGKVAKCHQLIKELTASMPGNRDLTITRSGVANARVDSPNWVLETKACFSYASDQLTTTTVESEANPEHKRRKLNDDSDK